MTVEKKYARIIQGKIIEYPIYEHQIINRRQPLSLYTEVQDFRPKPPIEYHQYLVETPVTDGSKVWLEYTIKNLPPELLLKKARKDNNEEMIIKAFVTALDEMLDKKAQEKGYDNRITCSLRAGYPGPFQQEGIAFAQWMDQCYQLAYQILHDVKNGLREQPATIEEFLAEMPQFTWPE